MATNDWQRSIIETEAEFPVRRAVLLTVSIGLGCALGFVGWFLSGNQWWYLAIPCTMAAAWLMVANPERCLTRKGHNTGSGDSAA